MKKLIFFLIIFSSTVKGQFSGGDGSSTDPWLISNASQLNSMRDQVANKHYKLISDINLNDLPLTDKGNWVTDMTNTSLNFDGNNYIIRNMKQYDNKGTYSALGLFTNIGAGNTIKNLTLKNFRILDTTGTGNASNIGFLLASSGGNLKNIIIDSCTIKIRKNSIGSSIGGFVGYSTCDTIYRCAITNSHIEGVGSGGFIDLGCFVAYISSGKRIAETFAYNVNIIARRATTASDRIAVIHGNTYASSLIIEDCYFIGSVNISTTSGGAVVGFSYLSPPTTRRCYSVVNNLSGTHVTKRGWAGTSKNVTYSYFNLETIGTQKSASTYTTLDTAFARTTSQLKDVNTYETWDFLETWALNPNSNNGYPYLKWRGTNSISFLSPAQNSMYMLEEDQDTINLSWNTSSLDSTKLYFFSKYFIDSTTV
ncbi:MAG: hypothetical protein WC346_16160, partial [Methanogenium sp.]